MTPVVVLYYFEVYNFNKQPTIYYYLFWFYFISKQIYNLKNNQPIIYYYLFFRRAKKCIKEQMLAIQQLRYML